MKVLITLLLIFGLIACGVRDGDSYIYTDSQGSFIAKGLLQYNQPENGGIVLLSNDKEEKFWQGGNYKDGFRIGSWQYGGKDTLINLEWGIHSDTAVGLKLNIIRGYDSLYFGPNYVKVNYGTQDGFMGLVIFRHKNFKKEILEKGIRNNVLSQIDTNALRLLKFTVRSLDTVNHISVGELHLWNRQPTENYYTKFFSGIIGDDYIEVLVNSDNIENRFVDICFNGVLTNFYYQNQRLYYPFRRVVVQTRGKN